MDIIKIQYKLVILEVPWKEVKWVALLKIRSSKSKIRDNRFSRNVRSTGIRTISPELPNLGNPTSRRSGSLKTLYLFPY